MHIRRQLAALVCALGMTVLSAHAVEIFSEDFEDPPISGKVTTTPTGWVSVTGSDAGLNDAIMTGKTGSQFGWVFRNGGTLQITGLPHTLGAGTNYTLTCDLTFSRSEATYATAAILAGTNVIAITTNVCTSANDLTAQDFSLSFVALPGNPHIGKSLGVRLSGDYWDAYFDEVKLDATTTTNDTTPPTPTTMAWIDLPTSSVSNSITMMATNAADVNGVQYFFTNTVNGNVSGWQASPIWRDAELKRGSYSYKVKARDRSAGLNETAWSSEESAQCEDFIILYESFETPSLRPKGGNSAFQDPKWFLPPYGWYGDSGNYQLMIHDIDSTFPTETPFGEQFAASRGGYIETTTNGLGGHVLEANYTYRIAYNTGCAGERDGEENGVPGADKVELYAGTVLVASSNISLTLDDFSETNSVVFIPDEEHPNLGEPLKIRMSKTVGEWWYFVIYDNVKVYAIPPAPKGTVLVIR